MRPLVVLHYSALLLMGVGLAMFVKKNVVRRFLVAAIQVLAELEHRDRQRDDSRPRLALPCDRLVLWENPETVCKVDPLPDQLTNFARPAAREAKGDKDSLEVQVSEPKQCLEFLRLE